MISSDKHTASTMEGGVVSICEAERVARIRGRGHANIGMVPANKSVLTDWHGKC